MSFEQPKFEEPKEIEPEEIKEQEKAPEKFDFEKDKDNLSKDLTSEETKEIFETTEKEIRLQGTLEKWVGETDAELRQRAEHFGLEESVVKEIRDNLERSFQKDLTIIATPESIKELKEASSETIANLSDKENKSELKSLLDQLSEKDILDLLNRKLEGEVTPEEKTILDIFSYVKKGEKLGIHDPLSGKIEVSLLNSKSLKEYTRTLMHEFTHKALSSLTPETTKQQIGAGMTRASEEFQGVEKTRKEMTTTEKAQDLFFKNLLAINESLAHRVEEYYGAKHEPQYIAYRNKNKIPPGLFERIYSRIDTAAAGKSLKKFDHFAAHIYSFFANKWDENLSQKDLEKAAMSTIEEINKFKEK